MQKLLPRPFNRFITMTTIIMLVFHIFLFSNENDWSLLNSVGMGDSIVLLKMGCVLQII